MGCACSSSSSLSDAAVVFDAEAAPPSNGMAPTGDVVAVVPQAGSGTPLEDYSAVAADASSNPLALFDMINAPVAAGPAASARDVDRDFERRVSSRVFGERRPQSTGLARPFSHSAGEAAEQARRSVNPLRGVLLDPARNGGTLSFCNVARLAAAQDQTSRSHSAADTLVDTWLGGIDALPSGAADGDGISSAAGDSLHFVSPALTSD